MPNQWSSLVYRHNADASGAISGARGDVPAALAHLQRALRVAVEVQAIPTALEQAGTMLGIVLAHPASNHSLRRRVEDLLATLPMRPAVPLSAYAARRALLDLPAKGS